MQYGSSRTFFNRVGGGEIRLPKRTGLGLEGGYRFPFFLDLRTSVVSGLLVFSHWVLDATVLSTAATLYLLSGCSERGPITELHRIKQIRRILCILCTSVRGRL